MVTGMVIILYMQLSILINNIFFIKHTYLTIKGLVNLAQSGSNLVRKIALWCSFTTQEVP